MNAYLQISPLRSLMCTLLVIAVTTGCSNFENSLPWSHSPVHEKLPGSWNLVKDSEPPIPIEVVKNESGSLYVEMMVIENEDGKDSDSSQTSDSNTQYVSFEGDVLALNNIHVLQIDMRTYVEHKGEDEGSDSKTEKGYRFLKVVPDGETIVFRELDIEQFARFAETQVYAEDTTLTASQFASCINQKIRTKIASNILANLVKERPTNLLSEDELSELEQVKQELENREVQPYRELQQMRECIAYKLPGDVLGKLFSSDPEASFRGETFLLKRTVS